MRPLRHWAVFMMLVFASTLVSPAQTPSETLAVIVHPTNSVGNLSFAELRRIVRLDQQYWAAGEEIRLLLPAPSADGRDRTLERVFQMSEQAFRQHWIAVAYRVKALNLPRPYDECGVALRIVASLPGAMAIVPSTCIDESVRVLTVEGKKPGQEGYRL